MNEFQLIQAHFDDWPTRHPNVVQSIGDDCLVWLDPEPLVISTDTAVIHRHFPAHATPEQIAQRAFLPAISDMAAMTATPAFFTLALTLPASLKGEWLSRFAKRLKSLSQQYDMMLAGGDTTSGEQLTVTISVHGRCPHPVLRSGAEAGDFMWVTGNLGGAAAALPHVLNQTEQDAPEAWRQAYWAPEPPIAFAAELQGCIHSAIDLSDGLLGDAAHLAQRSQVELALDVSKIPMDAALTNKGEEGLKLALSGGDDYQLLFSASPQITPEIEHLAAKYAVKLTQIGEVKEGKAGVRWYDGDRSVEFDWQSFTHF